MQHWAPFRNLRLFALLAPYLDTSHFPFKSFYHLLNLLLIRDASCMTLVLCESFSPNMNLSSSGRCLLLPRKWNPWQVLTPTRAVLSKLGTANFKQQKHTLTEHGMDVRELSEEQETSDTRDASDSKNSKRFQEEDVLVIKNENMLKPKRIWHTNVTHKRIPVGQGTWHRKDQENWITETNRPPMFPATCHVWKWPNATGYKFCLRWGGWKPASLSLVVNKRFACVVLK